jgi:hypothetical protein
MSSQNRLRALPRVGSTTLNAVGSHGSRPNLGDNMKRQTKSKRTVPRAQKSWLVSASVLALALSYAAPARAYQLDPKTQTVSIVSLPDFDKCQKAYDSSGSEACLDALKAYVKKHPREAFDAGKRAHRHFMHWVALDFFAVALSPPEHRAPSPSERKSAKARCADPDVAEAVVSGLSLPPHYPAVALAQTLLRETCWEQLEPVIVDELGSGPISYFQTNTCSQLALRSATAAQCKSGDQKPAAGLSSTVAQLKTVDASKLKVDPDSATALRGPKGEEVLLARTRPGPEAYVLVKFKGVRGPFNEQVLVAVERRGGVGKDYVIAVNDAEWVVLSERAGQYQAFPKDMPEGFWAYAQRPSNEEAFKLPTRSEIAREFASASSPGR